LDLSGNKSYLFGGDQDSFNYNSFRIQVFPCPNCTDYLALASLFGNSAYFEMIVPQYYYDVNMKEPLGIRYNFYDQRINVGNKKKDKLSIQNITSLDDKGWVVKDDAVKSYSAFTKFGTDYDFFTMEYIQKFNIPLYEVFFYSDKEKITYSRSFMKIQDIAAQVNGVLAIILVVCNILTVRYNQYKRNEYLFNEIFEYNKIPG
jgi:hypothetical protein